MNHSSTCNRRKTASASQAAAGRARRKDRHYRPRIENLESRALPAVLGTLGTLATLTSDNGIGPGDLLRDTFGNLYGVCSTGGTNGVGTVFAVLSGSNAVVTLAVFNGTNGANPDGGLIMDRFGNLFGITQHGGATGQGTVFELPAGSNTITTLASFTGANGANPRGRLAMDALGNLFGTTQYGGPSWVGTVFELPRGSNVIQTVASFDIANGAYPFAGLTRDAAGNLFGTTYSGGPSGDGTVFEVPAAGGGLFTLASFSGANGAQPAGNVFVDARGNMFGTTESGGPAGDGTIFEVLFGGGDVVTLASFNNANGAVPESNLVMDAKGNLFGTTKLGGAAGLGTVFELVKGSSSITTLATFNGSNGAYPGGNLKLDPSGYLYGAAEQGVSSGVAIIYKLAARPVAPTITSTNAATFVVGQMNSFTATAVGSLTPVFSVTGTLPSGVTFNSDGGLSGAPAPGTGGAYRLVITANNGINPKATQVFTLRVNQAPAITSSIVQTFQVGKASSFNVTTTGFPTPTLSKSGILPGGVSFDAAKGILSGTPATGTGGRYSITFTASNGIGAIATQVFTLTVNQAPSITNPSSTIFTVGRLGFFQFVPRGFPTPAMVVSGNLPTGVTFNTTTFILSGTPAARSAGTYQLVFTASNGIGASATQVFTLKVVNASVTPSLQPSIIAALSSLSSSKSKKDLDSGA